MDHFPNLKKAPIVEALIDIRVEFPPEFKFDSLKALHELVNAKYPILKTRMRMEGQFTFGKGTPGVETSHNEPDGFIYTSRNKKNIFQSNLGGFTFSRLKPYENWKNFSREAFRLWSLYSKTFEPFRIKRIATRFINRLELPLPIGNFEDFLTGPPRIPPRLPQTLISFFSRVVIPEPRNAAVATIMLATEQPPNPEILPVLLDIDVFKEVDFDWKGKKTWGIVEDFREVKNRIFFDSITEKLEARYK